MIGCKSNCTTGYITPVQYARPLGGFMRSFSKSGFLSWSPRRLKENKMVKIPAYAQPYHKSQRPARVKKSTGGSATDTMSETHAQNGYVIGLLSSLMIQRMSALMEIR